VCNHPYLFAPPPPKTPFHVRDLSVAGTAAPDVNLPLLLGHGTFDR
jgi:hypothetical protein